MFNLCYIETDNKYRIPEYRQDFYRQFGVAMQAMREINNISVKQIAEQMNVSEDVIRRYEGGAEIPFVDALFIYDYLDMQNRPVFRTQQ